LGASTVEAQVVDANRAAARTTLNFANPGYDTDWSITVRATPVVHTTGARTSPIDGTRLSVATTGYGTAPVQLNGTEQVLLSSATAGRRGQFSIPSQFEMTQDQPLKAGTYSTTVVTTAIAAP